MINLAIAFMPLRCPVCCSEGHRGAPLPAGAGGDRLHRWRLRHSLGRAPRAHDPRAFGRRHDAARRPEARAGADDGADSRHVAFRRDDHRRTVLRPVAQAATEFSFFLAVPTLFAATFTACTRIARCSRSTISACGSSVSSRPSSRPSSACAGCCASFPATTSRRCLVSHRLRRRRAGHLAARPGRLDARVNRMSAGILYLHGFCSSPESWKAKVLGEAMRARGLADRFFCPALSPVPNEAIAQAEAMIAWRGRRADAGRQFARRLLRDLSRREARPARCAGQSGRRCALVAPCLHRHAENLHTDETFEFTRRAHRSVARARMRGHHAGALPAAGRNRRRGARLPRCRPALRRLPPGSVFEGGDHSFTRFPDLLPQLFEFCRL